MSLFCRKEHVYTYSTIITLNHVNHSIGNKKKQQPHELYYDVIMIIIFRV